MARGSTCTSSRRPASGSCPRVAYFTGRAREGLKDPRAAEAYRAFLSVKQGDEDPMAADARRRLAKLEPAAPRP